jgi:predicted SAM-dependent methyltransferase
VRGSPEAGPVTLAPTFKQRAGQWLFPRLPITRFLFDQLRFEVNGWRVRVENQTLPWRRAEIARLREQRDVLVNVACGPHVLDGFVNLDLLPAARQVVAWDCRRSVPLADGSAAGIRVEQFVEHLEPREELPSFLRDCLRALKPGGVLRVIVPDAGRFLHAYCAGDLSGFRALAVPHPFPADLPTRMDVVNHIFHQWHEHRWAYDFETLALRLTSARFTGIEQMRFGVSLLPALAQDRDTHAAYSLYVDARKEG